MSYQATVYRILIASPNDVVKERKAIPDVINSWNAAHSEDFKVVLLPVMWETHSTPEMGDRPQAIINRQLVANCDILIGAFWTRLGTHTGVAESGTVEEIKEFINAGKPVIIYFSSVPVALESVDHDQYSRLTKFKEECQQQGLIETYSDNFELREKLNRHLTGKVKQIHGEPSFLITETDSAIRAIESIKDQYQALITRAEVDWSTERDRQPMSIEDGRYILKSLASDLMDFTGNLKEKIYETAKNALIRYISDTKKLQDHQVFLDGGKSYNEFWEKGDQIFNQLRNILTIIQVAPQLQQNGIDDEKVKILQLLAKAEDYGNEFLEDIEISSHLKLSLSLIRYHLGVLEEKEYIDGYYTIGEPTRYAIVQKGRQFLIKNNLL